MWVQQNTNSVFYYQKTRVDVDGGLPKHNMVFHFGYPNTMAKGDDD
jgi:hypothetical protein